MVRVEGLVKRYGARTALAGVTFEVGAGEIVGLLGPNGAGKSTTLAVISTLLEADAGMVTVAGQCLPAAATRVRHVLGYVPQQLALYPTLTALENLRFFGRMQGLSRRETADAAARVLALVGLESRADELVALFSGGMSRRLNLACGILHRPRVILLDEPTAGVDPQSRERIYDAAQGLAREGAAILYSTHLMEEAERLCQRVVLLDAGRVVAAGTTAELVATTGAVPRLRLRTARPLLAGWLEGVSGVRQLEHSGTTSALAVSDLAAVPAVFARATRAGGEVLELAFDRPSLADVFLTLTGHGLRDGNGSLGTR